MTSCIRTLRVIAASRRQYSVLQELPVGEVVHAGNVLPPCHLYSAGLVFGESLPSLTRIYDFILCEYDGYGCGFPCAADQGRQIAVVVIKRPKSSSRVEDCLRRCS